MPLLAAAGLAAGANLASQGINSLTQAGQNRKNRLASRQMYDQQRRDAWEDFYAQNAYNSPEQQMQRLQKAGLNPNLVYGNGAVANNSEGIRSSSYSAPHTEAPRLGLPQVFDTYFDVATKQQALSNQKQIGNNLAIDALMKTEDARSKNMLNNYMSDRGYKYRGESERDASKLMFERYLAQNAQNAFNFGGDLGSEGGVGHIDKGSAYSLQAMGLKIMNDLRSAELSGKRYDNRFRETKGKYAERMMSGDISKMGSADWLRLAMQAMGLFK